MESGSRAHGPVLQGAGGVLDRGVELGERVHASQPRRGRQ
jgi:hypothetical protein